MIDGWCRELGELAERCGGGGDAASQSQCYCFPADCVEAVLWHGRVSQHGWPLSIESLCSPCSPCDQRCGHPQRLNRPAALFVWLAGIRRWATPRCAPPAPPSATAACGATCSATCTRYSAPPAPTRLRLPPPPRPPRSALQPRSAIGSTAIEAEPRTGGVRSKAGSSAPGTPSSWSAECDICAPARRRKQHAGVPCCQSSPHDIHLWPHGSAPPPPLRHLLRCAADTGGAL